MQKNGGTVMDVACSGIKCITEVLNDKKVSLKDVS